MSNRSASLAMSTCVLKASPGKLDIIRHSPSILYFHLKVMYYFVLSKKKTNKKQTSEYDWEMPQTQTTDQPMAPQGIDTEQ